MQGLLDLHRVPYSLNVVCIVLESMEELERQYRELFLFIEIGSTLVFATEYLMRLWSCVESNQKIGASASNSKKRLKYVLSPMAIVDLVAFLPFTTPGPIPWNRSKIP